MLAIGWKQAVDFKFVYAEVPEGPIKQLTTAVMVVQRYGAEAVRIASVLGGVVVGFALSGEWQVYLLAQNSRLFHKADPVFGWDYSFFVFKLPWYEACLNILTTLLVLVAVLHAGVTIGLHILQRFAPVDANLKQLGARACAWLGIALIAASGRIATDVFEYGSQPSGQFVGAGYTAVLSLKLTVLLAVLVAVVGVATLISRRLTIARNGAVLCASYWLIGVQALPVAVQRIHVEPDKNHVEAPYASRAIAATRFAFGLNDIDVRNMPTTPEPSVAELASSQGTLDNMRLWDPSVMQSAIDQLQSFKQYYTFRDVDIDRYSMKGSDGVERMHTVMISPRDVNVPGLGEAAQTWVNSKLVYTHGYGVVVAPVNEANALGQPVPLVGDIPVTGPAQLHLDRPQIYFSDDRTDTETYAIVNTGVNEFDYPTQSGNATHRWEGRTGIHIDGLATRIAFSIVLGDGNLLVTNNLVPGSRLLLHRGVLDRAQRLYPFLSFDRDPYVVIVDGRIVWVLDGYTSTDRLPYAQDVKLGDRTVNYARNSVKVVVDAYSGQLTAYEVDAADPILQAYEGVYPGLIHPITDIPDSIRTHFRYPEDLFSAQTEVLTTYHVTDPQQFLSNNDAWSIPTERGIKVDREPSQPYFLQMRLPDAERDEFLLIRGFTPFTRDNLSGWIAAHCDAPNYGKLTLFLFDKGDTVPGPWQAEQLFVQDPRIADVNRQFNNDQSQIIVGNLLVVPVGHSIVYAESLFLKGRTAVRSIPELRRVILSVKDRIVMGDTYADALHQLFSDSDTSHAKAAVRATTSTAPAGSKSQQELVAAAVKALDDADAALRQGNFAVYGEREKAARMALKRLMSLSPSTARAPAGHTKP